VFGPEAVIVFFLLSGFVIYYSASTNPLDLRLRNYSIKRIRRIYPIFLCAMIVAYLGQAVVLRSWFVPNLKMLLGNLVMCQGISIDPFYDGPLWSLSYEWWFYVLFFLVIKLEQNPGRRQFWAMGFSLAGLISALIYLNQASLFLMYFMIWWCGAELARQYVDDGKITWRRQRLPVAALTALSLLSVLFIVPAYRAHAPLSFIEYPILFSRHLFSAVLLIAIGIAWHRKGFVGFDLFLGKFAVFAPISYGIYVLHAPILFAVDSFAPGGFIALKIAVICLLILGMAYVLEILMQSKINRWSNRFLTGKPRPHPADPQSVVSVAAA
jgi:peptidoglycan/LPS O-acetylase OafA/YrhL